MAKFRSWNKDKKKFYYFKDGYYYPTKGCATGEGYYLDDDGNFNWQNAEQTTELCDKNGKEIFVGDIVKMHYFSLEGTCNGVVEEDREMIGIVGLDGLGKYLLVDSGKHYFVNYLEEPSEELEIIDNIHEGDK